MSLLPKGRLAVVRTEPDGTRAGAEGVGSLLATDSGLLWQIPKLFGRGKSGLIPWSSVERWEFGPAGGRPDTYGVIVRFRDGNAMLLNRGPVALERYSTLTSLAAEHLPADLFDLTV